MSELKDRVVKESNKQNKKVNNKIEKDKSMQSL